MFIEDGKRRYRVLLTASAIGLLVLMAASIALGTANIDIGRVFRIVLSRFPFLGKYVDVQGIKVSHISIVMDIRLPRILLAATAGMGLSVVGSVYQGIFRNPMADPFVLGISSGSALGAALAVVLGFEGTFLGISGTAILAFICAIITTYMVYNIARVGNKAAPVNLLLAGVAVSFFLSSIISILMILNRNQLEKIVFWTMGSFSAASWKQVGFLLAVTIPLVIIIYTFARDINIMVTGEDAAKSLGVDVERIKRIMFLSSSVVVASIVSVSGIIGFVGLIIPHMARIITGSDYKKLIPFCGLFGAAFLVLSDTAARTLLSPVELPVGAITSIFGAPYFIYLLYKSKKKVF